MNVETRVTAVRMIPQSAQFVTDSQDVQAIKGHIGGIAYDYDSFFVIVGDGDYAAVWGMCGIVPHLSKLVTQLL